MMDDDDDYDDEDDSDYEVDGGDMGMYDSKLDEIDELLHLKQTLDTIHDGDQAFFQQLTSAISGEEMNKLAETLGKAQALKEREAKCTADIQELQKKFETRAYRKQESD